MTDEEAKIAREEWFAERAAVFEFEAGFTRLEAERMALEMIGGSDE